MELPHIGEHCSLDSCNQLDFLPFTCDACKNIYCKEHHKYESHQCLSVQNKDRRVPVCPLCSQPISLSSSESVDQKVNEHIENYCKSDLAKHKRSNKCKVKGCKQRELIPVLCSTCKQNFCLRHRHENDHDCISKSISPRQMHQSSAGIRSGNAALSRFNQNPRNISPLKQNHKSSGAVSGRSGNSRQQTTQQHTSVVGNNLQTRNLTEDQALALALQASLAESSFQPVPQDNESTPSRQEEDDDLAFARALAESERDEQARQRRQNTEGSQKSKDSCCIS